jgi:predicted aldo/keto reductase-like oxidoreductase
MKDIYDSLKKDAEQYYKIECLNRTRWDEYIKIEIWDWIVEIKHDKRIDVVVKYKSKWKRSQTLINTTK